MSCFIESHIWTWAGDPNEIPEGQPCDCGMVKKGEEIEKQEVSPQH